MGADVCYRIPCLTVEICDDVVSSCEWVLMCVIESLAGRWRSVMMLLVVVSGC